MTTGEVFPASDLPGASKNWGRAVESQVKRLDKSTSRDSQTLKNNLRAFGGQLDTQSSLLQEVLKGRTTHSASYPITYISASSANTFPIVNRPFSFPAPYLGQRTASFNVSFQLVRTSSEVNSIPVWMELVSGNRSIWKTPSSVVAGLSASSPPGWEIQGYNASFTATIPAGQTEYIMRIYTTTFSGSVSGEVQNLLLTLTYGDQV